MACATPHAAPAAGQAPASMQRHPTAPIAPTRWECGTHPLHRPSVPETITAAGKMKAADLLSAPASVSRATKYEQHFRFCAHSQPVPAPQIGHQFLLLTLEDAQVEQ